MAREMTPQERAAIQSFYYRLHAGVEGGEFQERYEQEDIGRIIELLDETRRAALLECVQQLREGARLAQSREVANALSGHAYTIDRLAQEGASSIDLSPTIKDDGGYGEHF